MENFVAIVLGGGFSLLIAYFLGKKRQIGFEWSLFFCVSLTPIFGFIITMTSSKYHAENPEPSLTKKIFGWVFIVVGALFILLAIAERSSGRSSSFSVFLPPLGIFSLGYYLIKRGKGDRFDKEVTKNN